MNLWENQHAADILVTCALANHLQAYKISWDYPFNISYVASCPVEFGDTTFSVKDEAEEGGAGEGEGTVPTIPRRPYEYQSFSELDDDVVGNIGVCPFSSYILWFSHFNYGFYVLLTLQIFCDKNLLLKLDKVWIRVWIKIKLELGSE